MALENDSTSTNDDHPAVPNIENWLALYKSRVHEMYLSRPARAALPTGSQALSQSEPAKPTILVIEDNADEWFLIRWALLHHFPITKIDWLADSTRVIPYLDKCVQSEIHLPRLILVDLYMPNSQAGLNVLQAIKSHQVYKEIPTIIISRSSDPHDMTSAFTHSSNSYIVKPFTYSDWREGFSMLRTYWEE